MEEHKDSPLSLTTQISRRWYSCSKVHTVTDGVSKAKEDRCGLRMAVVELLPRVEAQAVVEPLP